MQASLNILACNIIYIYIYILLSQVLGIKSVS